MLGIDVSANTDTNASDALKKGVQNALLDAADAGFQKSQSEVAANSTDTGMLLRSGIPPTTTSDGRIRWGYNAPHAPHIEYGTSPHYPPIQPLKDWAHRVLGDEGAAYAVQAKIGAEGTPPQPFVRPGFREMERALDSLRVSRYVEDEL